MLDGLKAFSLTASDLPKLYVGDYFACVLKGANLPGAILFLGCAIVPVAISSAVEYDFDLAKLNGTRVG